MATELCAFLLELSKLVEEAIAVDDSQAHIPAYEPGGQRHVPYAKACDTTKETRRERILKFFGRGKRAVGTADYSTIVGEACANSLCGRGHGADPRMRIVDRKPFLDALLERPEVRERLKKAIADAERPDDFVDQCILRKRKTHSTYDMIDAYRHLMLIKHPSRGSCQQGRNN